ncbi:hypothetical protein V8D89_012974 [Ganoderma adspersum]
MDRVRGVSSGSPEGPHASVLDSAHHLMALAPAFHARHRFAALHAPCSLDGQPTSSFRAATARRGLSISAYVRGRLCPARKSHGGPFQRRAARSARSVAAQRRGMRRQSPAGCVSVYCVTDRLPLAVAPPPWDGQLHPFTHFVPHRQCGGVFESVDAHAQALSSMDGWNDEAGAASGELSRRFPVGYRDSKGIRTYLASRVLVCLGRCRKAADFRAWSVGGGVSRAGLRVVTLCAHSLLPASRLGPCT